MASETSPAAAARQLMRSLPSATLATALAGDGWPYASLVLVACDQDASPLLLISALAEHTKNLLAEPRASLLFDGTAGLDERLTGARVSVLGRAERTDDSHHRARYLARHPSAASYADFRDFAFYRLNVDRAHLVAGFGRIHWIGGGEIVIPPAPALREAEPGIVAHMNGEHADAVQLYAVRLLGRDGGGWRMTGCDPEGCDLMRGSEILRLQFARRIEDAEAARAELVRLVKLAREG